MDKSVKFRIELETNGEKVLGNLSMSVDEFKEAIGEAVSESKRLKDTLSDLTELGVLFDSTTSLIDGLNDAVGGLAQQFNSFDKAMRAVNTMAGKDAEGFEALKGEVEALGNVIPLTKEELANGLYQVISNGVPEDNWIAFLEQSSKAAVGGIADLGETVTVTSTLIKNYGLEWSAAGALQDKIQMTAKNGVTSFEQLAAALPRVTGNAATLGVSIDELMATFATLTGVSGNTAEVSTQLAAIFTALVKPSSEAAEMAEMMGVKFDAAAIKAAGGMQNFLTRLSSDISAYAASHGMLEEEIYGKLFGSAEALRALLPITGELRDTFQQNVGAMAESAGTIEGAFTTMAGSGESVSIMLQNQVSTMLDWAGSVASGIQPYLQYVAVTGHAIAGVVMMAKTAKAATLSIKALAVAHKQNAVVTALSAMHTKVVALAQRLLAASSVTATAGTWALNTAVAALYATLTLGVSAVITGLVTLFTSMGEEAAEASEEVDVLADSTEAFKSSAADAKAGIEMELASLGELIRQKGDASEKVAALNEKYGEAMGYYQTAAAWYDTLREKSAAYCQQIGYEAQARVLASQIASKELERDALKQQELDLLMPIVRGGKVKFTYEVIEGGRSMLDEVESKIEGLDTDIATLQKQYGTCINKMLDAQKTLTAGVAETQASVNWQTLSYTELGKAIESQKKKVGQLVGKNTAEAKKEAQVLAQMEARYKKWGEAYGLSSSSSSGKKDAFDGKKLIADAKSYKELGNNITYYQTQIDKCAPSEVAEIARLTRLKQEAEHAQEELKLMMAAMGRPVELKTLEDYDKELAYLREARKTATAENLLLIDEEIRAVEEGRRALEAHSEIVLELGEIKTYEQLEQQLAIYERRLKTAGPNGRKEIQGQIQALKTLREEWNATAQKPEDVSKLETMDALSDAISYYSAQQQKASGQELLDLTRTKLGLEQKLEAMKRLTMLPALTDEVAQLDSLSGKTLQLELELIGLEGIKSKIRDLQKLLADTKNPLDATQRREVERLVQSYQDYEKVLKRSELKFTDAWGSVKDVGSGIASLTSTLEGNGSAWEKVVGVVDATIQIVQGLHSIIGIIELLTAATNATTVATTASGAAAMIATGDKVASAPAEVAASAAVTAATKVEAMAFRELAASAFMAAHAYIPFAGFGIAAGMIAGMQGLVGSVAVTPFANGGLVYGPTLALMGEYSGASQNPEVIAPLDKLKALIGESGVGMGGKIELKIRGRNLEGVLEREHRRRVRS